MQEGRLVSLSGKFTIFSEVVQLPAQFFVYRPDGFAPGLFLFIAQTDQQIRRNSGWLTTLYQNIHTPP
jgi:hypothetical protein